MVSLSIKQIQLKLQQGKLPNKYTLQTPLTLSSNELIWTLSLFAVNDQMLNFISKLSENPDVTVQVNDKMIQQGSPAKFVHACVEHNFVEKMSQTQVQRILTFLKTHRFKGKNLNYLLKNLSGEAVAQFLLASKCFEQEDLLRLCNHLPALKTFPQETIQLLYDYFNKERRWVETVTPVFDMYYFANRVGHVLGLSNDIVLRNNGVDYPLETNWNFSHVSMMVLCEAMGSYSQRYPSIMLETILTALRRNVAQFKEYDSSYKSDAYVEVLAQYRSGELTFLSCGWPGHGVAVVFYGNYLIYTNRGMGGDPKYGSKIFKIVDPKLINLKFIRDLLKASTANIFHRILGQIIHFKKPVVRICSKPQKYNTCTLVNPKSSVEPMMILLAAGMNASEEEIKRIAYQERDRFKYKHFTNFIRNREIDELVKNMFYVKTDYLTLFYTNLVTEIIMSHHGQRDASLKHRQEKQRALDLFERTPERIQCLLRENKELMVIIDDLKLRRPFEDQILFMGQREKIIRNHKNFRSHRITIEDNYITAIDNVQTPKTRYSFQNARKLCRAVLKSW